METSKTSHYVIMFFRLNMISIVGVFHVGHRSQRIILEGQTQPWKKPYFLTPLKKNKKTPPVTTQGQVLRVSSLRLLYSIMHELTGVHFVLGGVKLGTTGGD